jgi:signal transduction histidine kinase
VRYVFGGNVSQPDEDGLGHAPRRVRRPWSAAESDWLGYRSAGEVLALLALILSVVALVVVVGDGEVPGSLRLPLGNLVARFGQDTDTIVALAILAAVALAALLGIVSRARAASVQRATRLARELTISRRQIDHLKETLRTRDEFLLAVVHELRAPLTHIVGYAELMSGGVRPRHPDDLVEMNAAVQNASITMLRLMDDLVEVTRIQSDGFNLRPRPVDLVQLVRGAAAGCDVHDGLHHLRLDVPDHWLMVMADPERIRQVLVNLLTNATLYSPDGGEIRVSAQTAGHQVRIEVQDHGIGVAADEQARIFERFYRANDGRALREQGSGLGLAIVKELIEAHGGEVGVSSKPGVGSTFWFTLPSASEVVSQDARSSSRRTAPAL